MMRKKIVVLGGGISGLGAALLAKKKGFTVFLSDNSKLTATTVQILKQHNIKYEECKHTFSSIISADEIIISPGIANDSSLVKKIDDFGIPIISEIEFAFRYTKAKIAAITGTNGKTTTTNLLGFILKQAGYNVLVAGNIGVSLSNSIIEEEYDYIVLELSSFQLDRIKKFRSCVAILLNISPDHLERYNNSFKSYTASKYKITKNQNKNDFLILNIDDHHIKNIKTCAQKLPISIKKIQKQGCFFQNNKIIINLNNETMTIQELALQGKHNLYNSMAAAMAARVFEVNNTIIRKSMIDFQNIEHRLEYVITVHGIDFINDSKATNTNAAWYALESMKKDVIWIVGGVDKGNDYSALLEMVEKKVKSIICLGKVNEKIINAFKDHVDSIVQASNMNEAVKQSYNLANKGDVVLLSPACASFDLFSNFEDRGMQFKREVRKL